MRSQHLWTSFLLAGAVIVSVTLPLLASDALEMTPRDVAGVVSFRGISPSSQRFTALLQRINPDAKAFSFDGLDAKLGLAPGSVDLDKPIHVIFLRPEELDGLLARTGVSHTEGPYPVIAFVPKADSALSRKASGQPNRIGRIQQNDEKYYFLMRDGILFVANKSKSLRSFLTIEGKGSLHFGLDSDTRSIYEQSDVFVHLPLAPWRNRLNPYVMLASNIVKLGVASGGATKAGRSGETQAVMSWFVDGTRGLIDEMDTFTLAASFDGKTFRLDHHHTFDRNGWVSDYLSEGSRSNESLFAGLPNQPFLVVAAFNWRCPGKNTMTGRFNKFVMGIDSITARISKETREKLLEHTYKCYGDMNGTYFMLTSPPGNFRPLQAVGGFWADDPETMLKNYRFVQDNTCEAMGALMPGGSCVGRLKEQKSKDLTFFETVVNRNDLPLEVSKQIEAIYGKDARFQEAVGGKKSVIYTVSETPWGVEYQIRKLKAGETLDKNDDVKAIRKLLHRRPDGVAIVNVGRMVATLPYLMELSAAAVAAQGIEVHSSPLDSEHEKNATALLGWSCRLRENSLSGRCCMEADDVVKCADLLKAFTAKVKVSRTVEENAAVTP